MAKKKEYIRWAIFGDIGLYTGQYLSRKDAIADHVWCLNKDMTRFCHGQLDTAQLEAWHRCRAKGDRAVKVKITLQ